MTHDFDRLYDRIRLIFKACFLEYAVYILGIETSCDETGLAIFDSEKGLLAHHVFSQTDLHAPYGGVIPELASRDHVQKLLPLLDQTLKTAQLSIQDLDAIAYTAGPGLIGALWVGAAMAHGLGLALHKPIVPVHHLEGHLLAPLFETPTPTPPFLALLVSGGHTQLMAVEAIGQYELLGESIDDAAGEAFDKTAKLLGLPYPGGAALAKLALQGKPSEYQFTLPMVKQGGLDFSFSGLKTQVKNAWQNSAKTDTDKANIAYAFQECIVKTLVLKCKRALAQTGLTELVVAGGVSANVRLREALFEMAQKNKVRVFFPKLEFCTDNGAMIALAGYYRYQAGVRATEMIVKPRWPLTELNTL